METKMATLFSTIVRDERLKTANSECRAVMLLNND